MVLRATLKTCIAVIALSVILAGCVDPTEGKPEAKIGDAVEIASVVTSDEVGAGEGDESEGLARANRAAVYVLTDNTYIGFAGSKIGGTHYGQFIVFEGSVTLDEGGLEMAKIAVTIDMTSTETDDTRLTGVLKGEHFFNVAEYPEATFVSTAISQSDDVYMVTGNLTIRGIAKSITFPADISLEDGLLRATAEFTINRKVWGVGEGWVSDTVVKDDVLMELDVVAVLEEGV